MFAIFTVACCMKCEIESKCYVLSNTCTTVHHPAMFPLSSGHQDPLITTTSTFTHCAILPPSLLCHNPSLCHNYLHTNTDKISKVFSQDCKDFLNAVFMFIFCQLNESY